MKNVRFSPPVDRRSGSSKGTRGPCRLARRFAPKLVALEPRTLLSTIPVMNDADSGSGSLRAAIAAASPGDTIDFSPSAMARSSSPAGRSSFPTST